MSEGLFVDFLLLRNFELELFDAVEQTVSFFDGFLLVDLQLVEHQRDAAELAVVLEHLVDHFVHVVDRCAVRWEFFPVLSGEYLMELRRSVIVAIRSMR